MAGLVQRDRILSVKDVAIKVNLCTRMITMKVKQKKFPPPVKLSERRKGWKESDVDLWIAERM